jgi:hypothetical protein
MATCGADGHEDVADEHSQKHCLENSTIRLRQRNSGSIGRWLAEQYEVPSDIPEHLAALLEQLVEPGNEN